MKINSVEKFYSDIINDKNSISLETGRYKFQKKEEKKIINEITKILELNKSDKIIDIGCGTGDVVIPLSRKVKSITAVDYPKIIDLLKKRSDKQKVKNMKFISSDMLKLKTKKKFNKVLAYSLIHYMRDKNQLKKFIKKLLGLTSSNGIILIGEIPNISMKKRFLKSKIGKKINKKFLHNLNKLKQKYTSQFNYNEKFIQIYDKEIRFMINYCNQIGVDAYILPIKKNLPFSYTRINLLIKKYD
jgi:ubiquinone/menaquinone biosynthesis C-methylase UbiE